jgi:hypothetical protein
VNALGLRVGRRFADDGVELLGGSSPMHLLHKAAGSIAGPATKQARGYGRHWNPVHLDFVVPDLACRTGSCAGSRRHVEGAVREANRGRIATLADPFGHGFCLIEFLNRGYDEIASS